MEKNLRPHAVDECPAACSERAREAWTRFREEDRLPPNTENSCRWLACALRWLHDPQFSTDSVLREAFYGAVLCWRETAASETLRAQARELYDATPRVARPVLESLLAYWLPFRSRGEDRLLVEWLEEAQKVCRQLIPKCQSGQWGSVYAAITKAAGSEWDDPFGRELVNWLAAQLEELPHERLKLALQILRSQRPKNDSLAQRLCETSDLIANQWKSANGPVPELALHQALHPIIAFTPVTAPPISKRDVVVLARVLDYRQDGVWVFSPDEIKGGFTPTTKEEHATEFLIQQAVRRIVARQLPALSGVDAVISELSRALDYRQNVRVGKLFETTPLLGSPTEVVSKPHTTKRSELFPQEEVKPKPFSNAPSARSVAYLLQTSFRERSAKPNYQQPSVMPLEV